MVCTESLLFNTRDVRVPVRITRIKLYADSPVHTVFSLHPKSGVTNSAAAGSIAAIHTGRLVTKPRTAVTKVARHKTLRVACVPKPGIKEKLVTMIPAML